MRTNDWEILRNVVIKIWKNDVKIRETEKD